MSRGNEAVFTIIACHPAGTAGDTGKAAFWAPVIGKDLTLEAVGKKVGKIESSIRKDLGLYLKQELRRVLRGTTSQSEQEDTETSVPRCREQPLPDEGRGKSRLSARQEKLLTKIFFYVDRIEYGSCKIDVVIYDFRSFAKLFNNAVFAIMRKLRPVADNALRRLLKDQLGFLGEILIDVVDKTIGPTLDKYGDTFLQHCNESPIACLFTIIITVPVIVLCTAWVYHYIADTRSEDGRLSSRWAELVTHHENLQKLYGSRVSELERYQLELLILLKTSPARTRAPKRPADKRCHDPCH